MLADDPKSKERSNSVALFFSQDPFIWRAALAGVGVAVACGPVGCFVVWRRMAYFGDSLAHGSMLGVALGLFVGVGAQWGTAISAVAFAALLLRLQRKRALGADALLGIMAHSALSFGMIAAALLFRGGINVDRYLFGDMLAASSADLVPVYAAAFLSVFLTLRYWPSLMLSSVNEDLAAAEGVNVDRMRSLVTVMAAMAVAAAVQTTGMLLVTSLLIVPAASARQVTRSPGAMAAVATIIGCASVLAGLGLSLRFDVPSGPAVVAVGASAFFALFAFARKE
ncbi:MAG: iron chelate uptake ABC transporter family permease subunit [Rickettsiales bacterium]